MSTKDEENEEFLYALSCRSFQLRTASDCDMELKKKYFMDCCNILQYGCHQGMICYEFKEYVLEDMILNHKDVLLDICKDEMASESWDVPHSCTPEVVINAISSSYHRSIADFESQYGQSEDFHAFLSILKENSDIEESLIECTDNEDHCVEGYIDSKNAVLKRSTQLPSKKEAERSTRNSEASTSKSNIFGSQYRGFRTAGGMQLKRQRQTNEKQRPRFVPPLAVHRNSHEPEIVNDRVQVSHEDQQKSDVLDDRIESLLNLNLPKNIDRKLAELIMSEVIEHSEIDWNDIAGLEGVKQAIKEVVIWPLKRPDLFVGLRGPPRGVLLFGPPGTGKTMIGRCIASQSGAKFFSISASSLTSKWEGEGEKLVRTMFTVASSCAPSVIFVDEIDSLLTKRRESENEATRRIKTEFLVQMDGICTKSSQENRILLLGATNRPQELDEAARRRFTKRLYVPLPDEKARKSIIMNMLKLQRSLLTDKQMDAIVELTEGYSGADMSTLCSDAAMGPIRRLAITEISTIREDQVEPVGFTDFQSALCTVKASVSATDLGFYQKWNSEFGSFQYE